MTDILNDCVSDGTVLMYEKKRKVTMVNVLHKVKREYPDASKAILQQMIRNVNC